MSAAPHDPMLSGFPCAWETDTVADQSLSAIIDRIRSHELADATAEIRERFALSGGSKKAIESLKKRLPGVTLAGVFSRRANAAWQESSSLVQLDLDGMSAEKMDAARTSLIACPWIACLWASPSGAGLKGAVRVPGLSMPDANRYCVAWRAITRWLESLGFCNDPAAKDAARLAFLAHDPVAYFNPQAAEFPLDDWTEPEPQSCLAKIEPVCEPSKNAGDVIRRALAYIEAMPPSVQGSNGSAAMVAVVRALRDGFDLSGAELWRCLDAWNASRASPVWSQAELQHALASVKKVPPQRGRGWLLADDSRAEVRTSEAWPTLTPLDNASTPPPFDTATMIPPRLGELRDLSEGAAESLQVPCELIASATVGLAALAISRAAEIELMPGWREPAPLWMIPLLRPGERKSASLGLLTKPFHDWAASERKHLSAPLARYAEQRRTMEAELATLRARIAKGKDGDIANLREDALSLAAQLDAMPAKMAAPDLLVQSFTPEGLRDMLELNGEKVGIVSAECDAAELLGARYSDAGPSLDILLCAHAGDPITTRRAGGRVVPLERPAVGLVLAVQPEAVRSVLADRAAKGRGLIDRMLLIAPPSRMGSRVLDPVPLHPSLSQWWASVIARLLDLSWTGRAIIGHDGGVVRCSSPPRILTIDAEARALLWGLRDDIEPRLAEGADLAAVSGFASKLPGACARIALAFAMLRDHRAEVVDGECMRAAVAWAPFLLAHHRTVLGDAAEPPEMHHARRLWRALQRHGRATMTARDMFRQVSDSALPTMADFRPVLDVLADHGAVRPSAGQEERQGRPAERWDVHPAVLGA